MAEGLRAREHHVRIMPYVGGGMNATGTAEDGTMEGAARRAILAGARTGERRDEE